MELNFVLNGQPLTIQEVDETCTLLELLRERLGLTGTKHGCDNGVCGACSVLLNGQLTKSCRTTVTKVEGAEVTTIEGLLGADGELSDLQEAFLDYGAVQCGFCTPGMVIAAEALLRRKPNPTRAEIRRGIAGNICRCTGYQQIVNAVEGVATQRLAEGGEDE